MQKYIEIFTTTENRSDAESIAETLVERKLAGCVQVVGPIQSTYRWKGKVEKAEEWLCLIKTSEALYQKVEETLGEIHPYEVPQIIALPVTFGSKKYLDWLGTELMKGE
jgi:periplasmic divalent cation tolerance protein